MLTLISDRPSMAPVSLWEMELTDGAGGWGTEDSGLNLISNSCRALKFTSKLPAIPSTKIVCFFFNYVSK